MKKIFQQNLLFLIPYFLFLLVAGIFLSIYSKGEAHLILNQWRNYFLDYFFYYTTFIGDGVAVVLITILLCFIRFRYALFMGLSNIISSLITQTLKQTFFSEYVRPKKFFEGVHQLNLVPWAENYSFYSFPSGHTTAAFATFFCLALIVKNKMLKFFMFLIALTVGLSRVYLSQHFLNDVYAGSLIGVTTAFIIYRIIFFSDKFINIKWRRDQL